MSDWNAASPQPQSPDNCGTEFVERSNPAGQTIQLHLVSSSTTPLSSATASASGSFTTPVTVPDVTAAAHTLVAMGASGPTVSIPFSAAPQTVLSAAQAGPGCLETVSGHGFGAGETVHVYWKSISGSQLATATASGNGDFAGTSAVTFGVPFAHDDTETVYAVGHTA